MAWPASSEYPRFRVTEQTILGSSLYPIRVGGRSPRAGVSSFQEELRQSETYSAQRAWFVILSGIVPFVFFALPMGLENSISQPASIVLLTPVLFLARRRFFAIVPIAALIAITSF